MGKLLWLASYPKSGNTWVRAFLQCYATDAPPNLNALADVSLSEANRAHFTPFGNPATEAETQRLRPLVHAQMAARSKVVFVKTHNANLAREGIPYCTPAMTGGAIYIVRDPRDTALSFATYTGNSLDETIALMGNPGAAIAATDAQVFEYLSSWSTHAASWAAAPNRLLVRYEDLLSDPEKSFGRILRYIGTTPEPARLARAIMNCRFDALSAQERTSGYKAHSGQTPFFRKGEAGQWRTALSEGQLSQIFQDHGVMMRNFGYL